MKVNRRCFLAAALAAASRIPANRNVKWAVSLGLWNYFRHVPFTGVLDVMRDTGFIGIRLTGFPGVLEKYGITAAQMEREVSRRGLHVATISYTVPAEDPIGRARTAMEFLKRFGAKHLVVFPPAPGGDFARLCRTLNLIGEAAGEMGFLACLHNHLNSMVETPAQVHRAMRETDPKLFHFAPDTAHLHLGGSNVVEMFERYRGRIVFTDYKDAKWTAPAADVVFENGQRLAKDSRQAKFFSSIYDLGDGEIDFPACHRILKAKGYNGWICVDLDTARQGPRRSYERCGEYVVRRLEPIYA
ncbi:MAG: sugar phosphate isomerase/epimerase family protein [Bryobacteraceae bacterium]